MKAIFIGVPLLDPRRHTKKRTAFLFSSCDFV
jgi:hypothetical protein